MKCRFAGREGRSRGGIGEGSAFEKGIVLVVSLLYEGGEGEGLAGSTPGIEENAVRLFSEFFLIF